MIDKTKAVSDKDGEVESFILTIKDKSFHCRCGANCFHKPDRENDNLYRCNSCDTTYEAKDA